MVPMRLKNFVKNHWKKVLAGGIAVQVATIGFKYATNRFMQYHEGQALEMWKKVKKQQHFESIEETCITTYLSLLPLLKESIIRNLDADARTTQLKNKTTNKLEIWEELKIISFSRVVVTMYGTSLLNVLLRIQLNVIGGYIYQESESEKKPVMTNVSGVILSNVTAIDTDLQHKYLGLANYLVHQGMDQLCELVFRKTKSVVGNLSLKQMVGICDLEQIFWAIVTSLKRELSGEVNAESNAFESHVNPIKHPWRYIFPQEMLQDLEIVNGSSSAEYFRPNTEPPDLFKKLLHETFDLVDSDDVSGILKSFESHGISHFLDRLAESVSSTAVENSPTGKKPSVLDNHHADFTEATIPLAKVIPLMNSYVSTSLTETDPWISLLLNSESVRALGANVFESFSLINS